MKYTITIPKPCSEKWNEMTPTAQGMFCARCTKEVIDFSGYSKAALSKKLASSTKLCGKFRPDQLNTKITTPQSLRLRQTRLVAAGFVSVLTLSTPAIAQENSTPVPIEYTDDAHSNCAGQSPNTAVKYVNGVVYDVHKNEIADAHVRLVGTNIQVKTNGKGAFRIAVPLEKLATARLTISHGYFRVAEIPVDAEIKNMEITLREPIEIMGEIAIQKVPGTMDKVKDFFKPKKDGQN